MLGYLAKLIIVGDSQVGKSSILMQFSEGRFQETYTQTIGVEFGSRILEVDGVSWKLQMWDTAGSSIFKAITRSYYRATACGFIVYSVSSRESFDRVAEFVQEVRSGASNPCLLLLGNKSDSERQVSTEEAQRLANELGLPFMEITARNKEQVDMAFLFMCRILNGKISTGEDSEVSGIRRY